MNSAPVLKPRTDPATEGGCAGDDLLAQRNMAGSCNALLH